MGISTEANNGNNKITKGPKRRPEGGEWEPNKKFTSETDLVKSQEYTQTLSSRVCKV